MIGTEVFSLSKTLRTRSVILGGKSSFGRVAEKVTVIYSYEVKLSSFPSIVQSPMSLPLQYILLTQPMPSLAVVCSKSAVVVAIAESELISAA